MQDAGVQPVRMTQFKAMPIDIRSVTQEQSALLLKLHEGHFADLKGIDIKPAKLTKSLSAFANAYGGELYIGIDEDRTNNIRHGVYPRFPGGKHPATCPARGATSLIRLLGVGSSRSGFGADWAQ